MLVVEDQLLISIYAKGRIAIIDIVYIKVLVLD